MTGEEINTFNQSFGCPINKLALLPADVEWVGITAVLLRIGTDSAATSWDARQRPRAASSNSNLEFTRVLKIFLRDLGPRPCEPVI